jgi:nucleoside phosphorylase
MSERKSAVLNITKALAGASFTVLAAIGSASGNIWLAGLSALPAASFTASDTIGTQLKQLARKDELLELPLPPWWMNDAHAWQDLCDQIAGHFPTILGAMATSLQRCQELITAEVVLRCFIEAAMAECHPQAFDRDLWNRACEFLAPRLLNSIQLALAPLIEQKQREQQLADTHTTALSTQKMADLFHKFYAEQHTVTGQITMPNTQPQTQLTSAPEQPDTASVATHAAEHSATGPRAVVLTAIPVEYLAVRAHLHDLREQVHPFGAVYERGSFSTPTTAWDVLLVEAGAGNDGVAAMATQAINYFSPDIMFFVGVAGGIKDVRLGDVVVATKVYGYEYGKEEDIFKTRPSVFHSTFRMEQRAKAEARRSDWLQRLAPLLPALPPRVFVAPIAAGNKVIASTASPVFKLLRSHFNDAIAVEMEGHGFLAVAHATSHIEAVVVRGISDLLDNKTQADSANFQELAACYASAFAFELLAKLQIVDLAHYRTTAPRSL